MRQKCTATGMELIEVVQSLTRPDILILSITRGETNSQWIVEYESSENNLRLESQPTPNHYA